ncbi:MAG: hypothetical protein [Circular genetic element sp.]|nr:MAG: hypothetical protein [Circular genetic element sp.]
MDHTEMHQYRMMVTSHRGHSYFKFGVPSTFIAFSSHITGLSMYVMNIPAHITGFPNDRWSSFPSALLVSFGALLDVPTRGQWFLILLYRCSPECFPSYGTNN